MKTTALTLLAALCLTLTAMPALADADDDAIRQVIQKAYVEGIQTTGDAEAIRAGFDPQFIMFVPKDEGIEQMSIETWISRIEKSLAENPDRETPNVSAEIDVLDKSGNVAVARIKVTRNGKHVFTDYMSLYKREDGWKIVAKVYQVHR